MGISYKKNEKQINLNEYAKLVYKFTKNKNSKIIFEPGRFIAGNAGILITKIIYIKKSNNKIFVILDAGMNNLMRPALYNAHHEIVPLKKAIGRISADLISPYPPGIPLIFPGEFLHKDLIDWMISQRKYWPDQIPSEILVRE